MEINQPPPASNPAPTPAPTPNPGNGTGNAADANQTLMAVLAYLGILVIIPLVTESRNNPFVKYHIKQGLVLLIGMIIASILTSVPVFGWILSPILAIATLILVIIGIMNVLNKEMKELPLIGHLASKINI